MRVVAAEAERTFTHNFTQDFNSKYNESEAFSGDDYHRGIGANKTITDPL